MYIELPFLDRCCIDTEAALGITEGPSRQEIEALIEALRQGDEPFATFEIPGAHIELQLEQIVPHPTLPDTWWFQGINPNQDFMDVYALWSPENSRSCYLADLCSIIDTSRW